MNLVTHPSWRYNIDALSSHGTGCKRKKSFPNIDAPVAAVEGAHAGLTAVKTRVRGWKRLEQRIRRVQAAAPRSWRQSSVQRAIVGLGTPSRGRAAPCPAQIKCIGLEQLHTSREALVKGFNFLRQTRIYGG